MTATIEKLEARKQELTEQFNQIQERLKAIEQQRLLAVNAQQQLIGRHQEIEAMLQALSQEDEGEAPWDIPVAPPAKA